jgi:hypothetical protein
MQKRIIFVTLLIAFVFISQVVLAAELSGTVYSQGTPAANLSISVQGKEMVTKTDSRGKYVLNLPPGDNILIIRGSQITVNIPPNGKRFDINL